MPSMSFEQRDTCWAVARPEKMLAAHTGWSGLHGTVWKEAAEGRENAFLMSRLYHPQAVI